MKLLNVIIGVLVVLLLVLGGILAYLLMAPGAGAEAAGSSSSTFSVLDTGMAGDYAYSVFNYRGSGNLSVLGLNSQPGTTIYIINDSQAVQDTRLADLVTELDGLKAYGFNVSVTQAPEIGDGIYVVPTGALPSYALFNLQQNSSNSTIIYLGATNLILSSGVKNSDWYSSLSPAQRGRIIVYNQTLDDFMDNGSVSLAHDILYESWDVSNSTTQELSGNGIRSVSLLSNGSDFVRLIYELPGIQGVYDSPQLNRSQQYLEPEPASIYPWERSNLQFTLNKTNGTAYFTIRKDGKVVERDQLRRVTDQNVFIEKLEFDEPGEYLLDADDDSGLIASGLLHVRDLNVSLLQHRGVAYVFSVMVDNQPMSGSQAYVSIGNSTDKRQYYVSDGQLVVDAQLNQGLNVFNIDLPDASVQVPVDNTQEPVFEFYLKYGVPGLLLVVFVYFGARLTKRPVYSLRFGDSAGYVRQEIAVPVDRALEAFRSVRSDMKLSGNPITPQEFSVGLKRYLTNGADITEGNVEEILKRLEKAGYLESHRDYYQLKGEGDVRGNVLRRIIRENLIEGGTQFQEREGKFVTKDFEIGFFGDTFSKKGLIIVDDKAEIGRIMSSLTEREQARLRIMQSNQTIEFVPIDKLSSML